MHGRLILPSAWKEDSLKFAPGCGWWHHARRWQTRFAKRKRLKRKKVSEEGNKAVVRRWIETFNNPYTPQTEVDVLAPGYIAHAPALPGPLTWRPGRGSPRPSWRLFPTFGSRWRKSSPVGTWSRRVLPSEAPTAASSRASHRPTNK